MQGHVAALDALAHQGPEGGQVLGQTHRCHDAGQFLRAADAEHLQAGGGQGVAARAATDRPQGHRQRDAAQQVSVASSSRPIVDDRYCPLWAA